MSEFDETTFVDRRDYPDYLLTPVQRKQMIALRFMYPELGHWSLFGLFCALLAYSFDVRIPELNAQDDMFLSFYKEATEQDVEQFLGESFIALSNEYKACNVSKPNRKRIALAMDTLNQMDEGDRKNMLTYINDYCSEKLRFDDGIGCFEISCDEELKLLLYGIEERYYTTRVGN